MALSNTFGSMLLAPGNKSAVSVGHTPVHGDYNPIQDAYQSTIYAFAEWRNRHRPCIALGPERPIFRRPCGTSPTAAATGAPGPRCAAPAGILDLILEN